ncbi:hypothetical protein TWF679_007645 [Orbilia oligospora]|uniref:Uncharacterized protein n=1 Tax=Orbilia oligospora TaxID=2813651 RepID=A0A8H8V6P3_ORBOL|nr:hypothetical protein TWF679_007645 [Orbilia oligospora]
MMNTGADEVSLYADEFEKYRAELESPLSEHESTEIAKAYKSFCEKQCKYFGKLVSLRTILKGLEKAPYFHEFENNIDACLANVDGAQIQLYVSMEEAISADKLKVQESKAILLNLNSAHDTFALSIMRAVSAWRDRPEPAPCSRAV